MSDELIQMKQEQVNKLRDAFMAFMHVLIQMPGAPMQKQQGFLRFDEGHMWMQNAVMSFQPPVQPDKPMDESIPTIDPLNPIDA
jgi:hypothetical protein